MICHPQGDVDGHERRKDSPTGNACSERIGFFVIFFRSGTVLGKIWKIWSRSLVYLTSPVVTSKKKETNLIGVNPTNAHTLWPQHNIAGSG